MKPFRVAAEHGVALQFTYFPGQFLTLTVNIAGERVKRSYTIASAPTLFTDGRIPARAFLHAV